MTTTFSLIAAPALIAGSFFSLPPTAQPSPPTPDAAPGGATIVETAIAAGRFDTLVAAVTAAELDGVLSGPGPFTVFAPTDTAFAKIPTDRIQYLLQPEKQDELAAILTYHVVAGSLGASDVVSSDFVTTVNGQRAYVSLSGGSPMLEGATIIATDIQCSNGIIHVIDEVIFPELRSIPVVAARSGLFDTLGVALDLTLLDNALSGPGPFTVFAPTDAAFDALPAGVLQNLIQNPRELADVLGYHVTSGRRYADDVLASGMLDMLNGGMTTIRTTRQGAFIEESMITVTDIQASNGVIHVIDAVLIP